MSESMMGKLSRISTTLVLVEGLRDDKLNFKSGMKTHERNV